MRALAEVAEVALGKAPPTGTMTPEIERDFELLTSPLAFLVFGRSCGDDGQKPPGHVATQRLVAANRFDLLRIVARGLSPEGRVYAARALRGQEREIVDRVLRLDATVHACFGCMNEARKTRELIGWNADDCPSCPLRTERGSAGRSRTAA